MPNINLFVDPDDNDIRMGCFIPAGFDEIPSASSIGVSLNIIDSGDCTKIYHILMHEMMHLKLFIGGKLYDGNGDPHGDNFQSLCAHIGLGFEFGPSQEYCRGYQS